MHKETLLITSDIQRFVSGDVVVKDRKYGNKVLVTKGNVPKSIASDTAYVVVVGDDIDRNDAWDIGHFLQEISHTEDDAVCIITGSDRMKLVSAGWSELDKTRHGEGTI